MHILRMVSIYLSLYQFNYAQIISSKEESQEKLGPKWVDNPEIELRKLLLLFISACSFTID